MTITPETNALLLKLFPQSAIDVGLYYGPAVARMGLTEFVALVQLLNAKRMQEAQEAVRAKMSLDELAKEKESLTPLFVAMANSQADALDLAKAMLLSGLKAAVMLALGVLGI